jgi:hypothetical protein
LITHREFGEYSVNESEPPRSVVLYSIDEPSELPSDLVSPSPLFLCFLAWDAAGVADTVARAVARTLLDAGAVYLCTFGSDCERVHDRADDEILRRSTEVDESTCIPTTWHSDESLDDALWFFLFTASPSEAYAEHCRTALVLSVGDHGYLPAMVAALTDPAGFGRAKLKDS